MTSLPAQRMKLCRPRHDRARHEGGSRPLRSGDGDRPLDLRRAARALRRASPGSPSTASSSGTDGKATGASPGRVLTSTGPLRGRHSRHENPRHEASRIVLSRPWPASASQPVVGHDRRSRVITEPADDGQLINPYDVHMVAGPFVGAPGESHVCTDWEIRWTPPTKSSGRRRAVTGAGLEGPHPPGRWNLRRSARTAATSSTPARLYRLRVRFLGDAPPPESDWSDWAVRDFETTAVDRDPAARAVGCFERSRPALARRGGRRHRPAGRADAPHASATRGRRAAGRRSRSPASTESRIAVTNPPPLSTHGAVQVVLEAGAARLALPASVVSFTDGSGQDRESPFRP